MLRIAVIGAGAQETQNAGSRLRGALLEACGAGSAGEPLQTAQAVAFVSREAADPDAVARALSARQHVLLATVIGSPPQQLDRLSQLASEQGVLLTITRPDRALPSRRLIRQQIENGKLGDIGLVRICRGEPASKIDSSSPRLPSALISDIDLAIWLVGRAPETAYAVQRNGQQAEQRCIQVHLGFSGGGMALVTHTSVWPSQDAHQSVSVIAAGGAAYSDGHQNRQLLFSNGSASAPIADEGPVLTALLSDFVDQVQSGGSCASHDPSWRQLAIVVAAVEQSIASGDAVPVECP
ncbi:MAG: hypothetical protein JNG89_08635 [Planctomycetaceae bacterium]|nr:hypothetical protein [Planctomycetaceae bacterium]